MSTRAEKRRASAAAAKARKQKILVLVLGAVLAVMLVIQGPTLLDAFGLGGSSDSESETRAVAAPVTLPPATPPVRGKALNFKGTGGDPFASRSLVDHDPRAGDVATPAGAKDPFALRGAGSSPSTGERAAQTPAPVAEALPEQIVIGTPSPNAVARRGWIVVLASIRTGAGRAYAERFAARVRLNGLTPVSVLDSSTNKPLRSGYFVVYTGPFATLDEVQRSAAHVHAFGYRTAYIREILRY